MREDVIFRYKNGRIIPIKVNKNETTNEHMNNKIRGEATKEKFEDIEANNPQEFKQKRKDYVDKNIKFETTNRGDYNTLKAILDDKIVGNIRYETINNQSNIIDVSVNDEYRRSGVATHLYKKLQSKTPNKELAIFDFTNEGEKLARKVGEVKKRNSKYYLKVK